MAGQEFVVAKLLGVDTLRNAFAAIRDIGHEIIPSLKG
jgi:hypothetical protein